MVCQSQDEIGREFGVDPAGGSPRKKSRAVVRQTAATGSPEALPPSLWQILCAQFTSLIVWVLVGAAVVR